MNARVDSLRHLVWHGWHALDARGSGGVEETLEAAAAVWRCLLLLLLLLYCRSRLMLAHQLLLLLQARQLHLQLHRLDLVYALALQEQHVPFQAHTQEAV